MKVYVIGKVTGLDHEYCRDMFNERERQLEAQGHEAVNPTRIVEENTPWPEAMKICIAALIDCDAVSVLPNAHFSRGATLEMMIAESLGMVELKNGRKITTVVMT